MDHRCTEYLHLSFRLKRVKQKSKGLCNKLYQFSADGNIGVRYGEQD